jgi:hypothetical protein
VDKNTVNLWKNYNMAKRLILDAMGGVANIEGEFAEKLVADYYGGEQLTASSKSADIVLDDGTRVQVKARVPRQTLTTSLGVIRSWDFDLLVAVLFTTDGTILRAVEMSADAARSIAVPDHRQNGWRITTTSEFLDNPAAKDITAELSKVMEISVGAQPAEVRVAQRIASLTPRRRARNTDSQKQEALFETSFTSEPVQWKGRTIETQKRDTELFQDFVKRTLHCMFDNKMIPAEEISRLLTKDYSKHTFGLEMPLLETDTNKLRDGGGQARYWVKATFGGRYYVCSQWWKQHLGTYEPRFAAWIRHIVELNEAKAV